MDFWGIEVKPGKPFKVQPPVGRLVHISQAALGEVKDVKGAKNVPLRMKIDGKDFFLGVLSAEKQSQLMFDLVFEKEFELSHDWKNGSVYFMGYIADNEVSDGEEFSSDESDEESEEEAVDTENGVIKPAAKNNAAAAKNNAAAAKAGIVKDEQIAASDEDEDDSEIDSDDISAEDFEEDDSEGDSSSEEDSPKVPVSKKRAAESPKETTVSAKKAKSGNKKGPVAAPLPSKKGGKAHKHGANCHH